MLIQIRSGGPGFEAAKATGSMVDLRAESSASAGRTSSGPSSSTIVRFDYALELGFSQFHVRTRPGSSHPVISFQIDCKDQDEVDHYWTKLSEGGEEGPCGWLKYKFGLSWQVVPRALPELLGDPDQEKAQRVMAAMMGMKKIDVAGLQRAYDGAG